MTRIRTLKPEMWGDEGLGRCSIAARLLFVGIITQADDEGRFRSAPPLLRSVIFPYEDMIGSDVEGMLVELEREGLIRRYVAKGENFGDLPGWSRHQKVSHPTESSIPPYNPEDSGAAPEDSGIIPTSSASRESLPIPSLPVVGEDSTRARDEQWDALAEVFGYSPEGQSEQRLWGKLVRELRGMKADRDAIIAAAVRYHAAMPNVELTPSALVKHYERLMKGYQIPKSKSAAGRSLELSRQHRIQEAR